MMQRCPLVIPFLMYSTRGRAFHVLRRARFPRNLATRSLTNTVEIATPPVMDWDDRIALQKSWSNSEKGWKVDVEWKMTPFGVGLFAAQDIVAGTILRTGVIGCNLKELSSIADIEAFCQSGREDEYDARLRYVADYLWGFTVRDTMDSIPLTLYPLVKRLEAVQNPPLSRHQLQSIVFVVRLGDLLHQSFYGSFLILSLISKLCNHLDIPDLYLEIEVFVMKWSFRQGAVAVSHRMTFDYDMYTVFCLTKIARAILNDSITVKDGLLQLKQHSHDKQYSWIEKGYRDFPLRALVIPLMSFSCATVYFGGTWYDLGFSCVCGIVAGLVAWITTLSPQLTGVMDYLVAILVAMISVASVTAFPNNACFEAQVMGTLYWFFYGTAYVLSLYEITNNQLTTGLSRFFQAILRSYGLAFGTLLGVWLAWFGPPHRLEAVLVECEEKESQIGDIWFILLFPLSAIACLMQFRVSYKHFFIWGGNRIVKDAYLYTIVR